MRKVFAILCLALGCASLTLAIVPRDRVILSRSVTVFTPVTNTYNSGSGSETIQTGAATLIVKVWGGGSGSIPATGVGNTSGGGGSGAYSIKTISGPFSAGTISYSVGSGGSGASGNASSAGGSSQLVNIAAVGGGAVGLGTSPFTGGAGGTAGTGGDTNTVGNAGVVGTGTAAGGSAPSGGAGGAAAMDGSAPGGGAGGDVRVIDGGANHNGGAGRVQFIWQ